MNITIKATNTTLTDGIRDAVNQKLSSLESFLKSEDIIHVEVDETDHHNSGMVSRVEVRISPHGYYAEANGTDFYEALDLVVPKIKQQMTKNKEKRLSLRRRIGNLFKRGE